MHISQSIFGLLKLNFFGIRWNSRKRSIRVSENGNRQNKLSQLRQYITLILSYGKDHTHGLDFFLWEHPLIKSPRMLCHSANPHFTNTATHIQSGMFSYLNLIPCLSTVTFW
jgi:hypothetical protein